MARLKQHPCIEEAEVSNQKKARKSNRVEFKLTAKVRCPPGVELAQTIVAQATPVLPVVPGPVEPGASGPKAAGRGNKDGAANKSKEP